MPRPSDLGALVIAIIAILLIAYFASRGRR